MDAYYPNTVWLCLERDVFEKLAAFKRTHGIPTFERALEQLLSHDPDTNADTAARIAAVGSERVGS
jgi:hypothetical protein